MERKGSVSKLKHGHGSWFSGGLFGGPGRAERHTQPFAFLRRSPVAALCFAVTIVTIVASFTGVTSVRHFGTTKPADSERELHEERDPSEPYRLGPLITDWDEQRFAFLERNPHMKTNAKGKPRLFMITGSATEECTNPIGDFWLLKAYKNKMDYCRLHNIESYYNMAVMDSTMVDFWIKLPLIRTMMLTHPEAEWIWWMDSDAMFTDMKFEIPVEKYADYNMVIHGWPSEVFEKKNWVGLNAGIFLMRNCQWTLDFLDLWGALGEDTGNNRWNMGKTLTSFLSGRLDNFPADDQASLIYLLHKRKDTIYPKVFLESSYYLHGYWVMLTEKYEENMANGQPGFGDDRWPFITHFVGCKLCGNNNDYPTAKCLKQMSRAFNFADNQVLAEFGFQHVSLESPVLRRVRHLNETSHKLVGLQ